MRIIAGSHRGRKLVAPPGMTTRPTTDRVREALFSSLGNIAGLTVIDCYSGTGALGFEAASRGAARVFVVECDKLALRAIEKNRSALGFEDKVTAFAAKVERVPRLLPGDVKLDLVLADPPWPIAAKAATVVVQAVSAHLAADALVVIGHPHKSPVELSSDTGLELIERKRWGDSGMSYYRPASSGSRDAGDGASV